MIQLTPALTEQIVAAIHAGGFPHVAAQAFGVTKRSFDDWRRIGRSNESDDPFRSFSRAIDRAIAQARLRAEMTIFTEQPRIWLQHGPGREMPGSPGWTVAVKPAVKSKSEANALLVRETRAALNQILDAVGDNAGLRERLSDLLVEFGMKRHPSD